MYCRKFLLVLIFLLVYHEKPARGQSDFGRKDTPPEECITLNNELQGDWYESQGSDSFLFPSHLAFIKLGPADGRLEGFSDQYFYALSEECNAILVVDSSGRLIVTYSFELSRCGLKLENSNRMRLYCKGGPDQCPTDCQDDCSGGPTGDARIQLQSARFEGGKARAKFKIMVAPARPLFDNLLFRELIVSEENNCETISVPTSFRLARNSWIDTVTHGTLVGPPQCSISAVIEEQWFCDRGFRWVTYATKITTITRRSRFSVKICINEKCADIKR